MKSMTKQVQGEELFIGIDLHKLRWHVTIRTADVEIFCNSIVGRWEDLRRVILIYPYRAVNGARCILQIYSELSLKITGCKKASTSCWNNMNF